MDYATPDRRKNRNDKRAKARFNRFKKGGALRTQQKVQPRDREN